MARRTDNSTLQVRGSLADRALSRVAGAPLIAGNRVRLLRDAKENYPAWLEAIDRSQRWVHFENFILH
jgi:cardiolipin synthase